jgi:hypothetical protein
VRAAVKRAWAPTDAWVESLAVRGSVLVVGPDGAGKTAIAEALASAATRAGVPVLRAHWRPGVLVHRDGSGAPVTEPHAREPRGIISALAKLGVIATDFALGWAGPWRRAQRKGLLVVERGWWDQVVDPRRYRMPARLVPVMWLLGRLMPRADVLLLLVGDPSEIAARKPELEPAEIARQQGEWRRVGHRAGKAVVELDAVSETREQTEIAAADVLQRILGTRAAIWRHAPLVPARLDLRVTGGASATPALTIYRTSRPRAHAAALLNRALVSARVGATAQPPVENMAGLARVLGVRIDGAAAFRSAPPRRWVVGWAAAGRMHTVLKVGPVADPALVREAEMLGRLQGLIEPFRVPTLRWAGDWHGLFVVATEVLVIGRRTPRIDVADVVDVLVGLAHGVRGSGPLVHGDFTSSNLAGAPRAFTLLDWESSREAFEPMVDLVHFVVSEGGWLGRFDPGSALSKLLGARSPGHRYCERVGIEPDAARKFLLRALRGEATRSEFAQEMLDRLG